MIATQVVRAAGLVAVYLLVLTSVSVGDVLVGAVLALAIVLAAGPGEAGARSRSWSRWVGGVVRTAAVTALEIMIGTIRVVRFCLDGSGRAGFVEIPRGDRSRDAVALWGLLTGEAPDEYPVEVDDARAVLVVHVVDARDPDAVRARHAAARERHQRDVVV